jgi:hypothetical protein
MLPARYNRRDPMRLRARLLVAAAALAFLVPGALAASWDQPSASLARQIAALTGPGPVLLTVRNRSSLSPSQVPTIRRLLERDLRGYGVIAGGSGSATAVEVTLSQNAQGGLWVAEVQEGTERRVAMLPVKLDAAGSSSGGPNLTLQRDVLITEPDPVLDAQILSAPSQQWLIVLEPMQFLIYTRTTPATPGVAIAAPSAWTQAQTLPIPYDRAVPRDMRGRIVAAQDHLFDAYLPGMECRGTANPPQVTVSCFDSDDPWPVTTAQKAFYNSARDYFTGVLAPGFDMNLAPFYEAAEIPRAGGTATLLNDVNGTAMLIANNQLETVNGAGDWGSDLAVIHSACGTGSQALVSGTGAADGGDSLRAYEIPGREAIPVSAPLQVPGTVMALWPGSDADHAIAIVRRQDSTGYEVWSVAASCD